ncbi:MAG: DUF2782 domain-containing protein [Gammaproteobacteria bacterium]|nr:DUF2782 domain-containing protein [Gammaproteobacteria bacterium]
MGCVMRGTRQVVSAIVVLLAALSLAQASETAPDAGVEAFPLPGADITISPTYDGMIEEYRFKGRVYMIKVTPRKGFSYYLVDTDGDGHLDARHSGLESAGYITRWSLFRWK